LKKAAAVHGILPHGGFFHTPIHYGTLPLVNLAGNFQISFQ